MPISYAQHRMNQYRQDVCYTTKFVSDCRKRGFTDKFVSVNNILCRCPSGEDTCQCYKYMNDCSKHYEFSHNGSLGMEVPIIKITEFNKKRFSLHYCPCPPDPCASKAFYNQCRDHETKNMHGVDVAEAEIRLHPKDYPMHYPETASLIGSSDISCFCPPRITTS